MSHKLPKKVRESVAATIEKMVAQARERRLKRQAREAQRRTLGDGALSEDVEEGEADVRAEFDRIQAKDRGWYDEQVERDAQAEASEILRKMD